ncbi:MAG: polysaccharide biosynthesis tyrosine autokinase [Chloroflexi bacterium]|nr:polysaccharide biosynthesis tyrosine autokinase [Chloroflexota bacterium]
MELKRYLVLLRRWLWLIVAGAIVGGALGYGYSLFSTRIYRSTLILQINQGTDPLRDPYNSILTSQRLAATGVEQLRSRVVLEQVIRDLDLSYTLNRLSDNTAVQAVRDTNLIRVAVEDPDPARAQAITNQIAKVFIDKLSAFQQAGFRTAQEDLERQVAEARKKIDETQKALAPLGDANDPKALSAPEFVRTERMRLQLELTTLQSQYSVLLKSVQDYRLAASRNIDPITIFAPADLNTEPVRPRISTNTLIGLAIGMFLGLGLAFLFEYLDDSIKTSDDVARVLELSVLGNVVRFPKGAKGPLVAVDAPRAPYVEAYRNLRTNLQFSFAVDATAALVVTSAEPGEGKSTTIANLAAVLAQAERRVILVDTDLRRPTQHQIFNLPAEPGLTDVFLNEHALDHAVRETAIPGLYLLAAGKIPPNPAELIASPWMDQLIVKLKEQYDIVLFDSPPILPVTDSILLAAKTKHLLWVISAGKTRTDTLRRAREGLGQVDAKIVGVVLNRVAAGSGYGSYYYHYYSQDGTRKPSKSSALSPNRAHRSGNGKEPVATFEAPPEALSK